MDVFYPHHTLVNIELLQEDGSHKKVLYRTNGGTFISQDSKCINFTREDFPAYVDHLVVKSIIRV